MTRRYVRVLVRYVRVPGKLASYDNLTTGSQRQRQQSRIGLNAPKLLYSFMVASLRYLKHCLLLFRLRLLD